MARTKEFDVDLAIDKALDLFWAKGYAATSMQDLVDHLGIHRGSLYGTFGSKENLYRLAFDRYLADGEAALTSLVGPDGANEPAGHSMRQRLDQLLSAAIDDPDGRGCFIVNTVCERNHTHSPSRLATETALDGWRRAYRLALEIADNRGELASGVTPEVGAEMLLVTTQGLRVMTKADADHDALLDVIASTLDHLLPPEDGEA